MSAGTNPSSIPFAATVERVVVHNADTRSLHLRVAGEHGLAFAPGQFISLQLPVGGETLIRPYSIASDPEQPELLEICLNLVPGGLGSRYLFELAAGAIVHFTGPWGSFMLRQTPAVECVFIADGTGIAPIRPMLHRALGGVAQVPIRLHYRAARADAALYRVEFEAAQGTHPRFQFEPIVSDSSAVLLPLVRAHYVDADGDRSRHFYVCGVGDIVTQLRDLLRRAGYERRAVEYEKW